MKNFKHSFKSNNKMKLAAVASAAVMLAPVAMTSVSTFADGYFKTTDSAKKPATVDYPIFNNGQVFTVPEAAALTINNQNGTAGNVQSNGLGATVGFNTTDVEDAMAKVASISSQTASTSSTAYADLAQAANDAGDKVQTDANKLATNVGKNGSIYKQLSADNQNAQKSNVDKISATYWTVRNEVKPLAAKMQSDAAAADKANNQAAKTGNATDQALADSKTATAQSSIQAYKNAVAKYQTLVDAVNEFNTAIARKTNNGAVAEAAKEAALAISKMDDGAGKKAAQAAFSKAQGDYLIATELKVDGHVSAKQAAANVAAINAAAQKAVKALNDVAGNAFTNKGTETVDPSTQTGVVKVNYPAGYGIQIWTKDGKAVRYNSVEAKQNGKKTGDAKKLPGQKSYKVFGSKYTANGTTYYNLGGDQYIDSAYVTFTAK